MTSETPRHGEITWEGNPELYEFMIQLGQHTLGMSTATPTWRADAIAKVKKLQREAAAFRKLRGELEAVLERNNIT